MASTGLLSPAALGFRVKRRWWRKRNEHRTYTGTRCVAHAWKGGDSIFQTNSSNCCPDIVEKVNGSPSKVPLIFRKNATELPQVFGSCAKCTQHEVSGKYLPNSSRYTAEELHRFQSKEAFNLCPIAHTYQL